MNVTQQCLIDFLHKNGIIEDYIDVHTIGSVSYYFSGEVLKFSNGCVPGDVARVYLSKFNLTGSLRLLNKDECHCNW